MNNAEDKNMNTENAFLKSFDALINDMRGKFGSALRAISLSGKAYLMFKNETANVPEVTFATNGAAIYKEVRIVGNPSLKDDEVAYHMDGKIVVVAKDRMIIVADPFYESPKIITLN